MMGRYCDDSLPGDVLFKPVKQLVRHLDRSPHGFGIEIFMGTGSAGVRTSVLASRDTNGQERASISRPVETAKSCKSFDNKL
jgi:hypothetical protein